MSDEREKAFFEIGMLLDHMADFYQEEALNSDDAGLSDEFRACELAVRRAAAVVLDQVGNRTCDSDNADKAATTCGAGVYQ